MIRCAFYAPLKHPEHPVPSGDRTLARAILSALKTAGHNVEIASDFQSRDGVGNPATQADRQLQAKALLPQLISKGAAAGWQAWITYHNYYKAPDLLGPDVSAALGIPYVLIEATRARKRLTGPWAHYAKLAEEATDAAATVFYLTRRDAESLVAYAPEGQRHVHLAPFLPAIELPARSSGNAKILSVGMFRPGDKLASYEIIAETLALLQIPNWHISIAGGGPAEPEIRALMSPFDNNVSWLGACDADQMHSAYDEAGILFWPGVNEAFGMTYLEAQAAGLVAVAQDRPGVRDVLAPGMHRPAPEEGPAALAGQIDRLLNNPAVRDEAGLKARNYVEKHHLLASASRVLDTELKALLS